MTNKYSSGINPRNILSYQGPLYGFAPCVQFPREPTTLDVDYENITLWRVGPIQNVNTIQSGLEGDIWIKIDTTLAGDAIWIKINSSTGPIINFDLDSGTSPITADGSGNVILTGARVSTGIVGASTIDTNGTAANAATFRIQEAGSNASTPNPDLYGVAQFDATQFTVTDGFVQVNNTLSSWIDVTTATQALAFNTGYTTNRGAGVTYTLPATAPFGSAIQIDGKQGIATINQNANQQIRLFTSSTTIGVIGTLVFKEEQASITLRCTVGGSSTIWTIENANGNFTFS